MQEENMWRLPVFCKPTTSVGKRRRKGSNGSLGSYGRGWKRATSTEVIKTPLLQMAEESLAQLHLLNDIIVFNKSGFEIPREAPSEAPAAPPAEFLGEQVLRILDKEEKRR